MSTPEHPWRPARSVINPFMTNPHGDLVAKTIAGQAHFAGTGPAGMTCRQCVHWGGKSSPRRDDAGELMPRRCRQFSRMMQSLECRTGIPHGTAACRHFIERATAPQAIRERKDNAPQ